MPTENLVGIHPHKAAVLATQLRRTAQLLCEHSTTTFDALVGGLEDVGEAIALFDATEWFGAQARELQRTLDELVRAYADAPAGSWGDVAVWRQPYAIAFDNPEAATRAAADAAQLLAAVLTTGDPDPDAVDRLGSILVSWQSNEVFAAELARHLAHGPQLGVAALVDLLELEAEWYRHGSPPEQAAVARVRELTIVTLSAASADGLFDLSFAAMRAELLGQDRDGARGDGSPPVAGLDASRLTALGFLFPAGARWGTDFLLDAATLLVVPLNATFEDRSSELHVGGVDPRVRVLEAVSGDEAASTTLLSRPGMFDALFAARFGYLDGGRALGQVLRSATEPRTSPPSASTAEPDDRARTMMQFVDWVLHHPDLPPVTRQDLGAITAPWIASFRKDSYDDDPTSANPLRALLDETRVAYLAYVADDRDALAALRVGELAWVRQALWDRAGPGFDGRTLELVSNVDRRTSQAVRDGLVRNLEREDDRINFDKAVWDFGMSVVTFFVSDFFDFFLDMALRIASSEARPTSNMALDYAKMFPTLVASDRAKLEHAVVSTLWERREENHVFDGAAPPPPSVVTGEPPKLLSLSVMTPRAYEEWLEWVKDNDVRRWAHFDALTVDAGG